MLILIITWIISIIQLKNFTLKFIGVFSAAEVQINSLSPKSKLKFSSCKKTILITKSMVLPYTHLVFS